MQYIVRHLGITNFATTFYQMQEFTNKRQDDTLDEFWLVEHKPVFTLGLAGDERHILNYNHNIPIVKTDRGGQVTYHAPGQIVIYTLIDLKRANLSIHKLVENIEKGIIDYLRCNNIKANSKQEARGVYIINKKIASLGLRVRRHCTYHGLSFNVNLDLIPFSYINPCGYQNLTVTKLDEYMTIDSIDIIKNKLISYITRSIYV